MESERTVGATTFRTDDFLSYNNRNFESLALDNHQAIFNNDVTIVYSLLQYGIAVGMKEKASAAGVYKRLMHWLLLKTYSTIGNVIFGNQSFTAVQHRCAKMLR